MDYRQTHLAKGDTYDATLAALPFDAYMARLEEQYLREVVPGLGGARARYLDFACGTGRITSIVAPLVGESVGVDVSESMLAAAREKCPTTRFVCVDLARESPDLGTFDLATSFRFFGNAQQPLRQAVLAAIAQRLRPGGHLIVNSHRNPRSIGSLLHTAGGEEHGMDLTLGKFKRLLDEQGFRVVSVRPFAVWVVRARMRRDAELLNSPRAASLERMFGHAMFAPLAPDSVLVAQRR